MTNSEKLTQAIPPHPGKVLEEEFLKPLHMSAENLALCTNSDKEYWKKLIAGTEGITNNSAILLASVFQTSKDSWLRLQSNYDSVGYMGKPNYTLMTDEELVNALEMIEELTPIEKELLKRLEYYVTNPKICLYNLSDLEELQDELEEAEARIAELEKELETRGEKES